MKALSRVLCAVDIDERSHEVFAHALALARRHGAKLLVLHAVSPVDPYISGATERVELLRRLRARAAAAGVDVRVEVQQGPADEVILLHALARSADLIVIGTSRPDSRRGLSGWIAERVLRDAPCPTLVIPQTSTPPAAFAESVLCAVDLSSGTAAVVAAALALATDRRRRVTLLHVANGREAAARDELRALIPRPMHGAVTPQVVAGSPASEIARAVRTTEAQLLVIGAGRRSTLGSRLFGQTAQLLRDVTCPLLAIPSAEARTESTDIRPLAA